MRRAFEQLGGLESRPPSDVVETLLRVISRFESLNLTRKTDTTRVVGEMAGGNEERR